MTRLAFKCALPRTLKVQARLRFSTETNMGSFSYGCSRRGFLLGAGAGLAAGIPLTLWAEKPLREIGEHVFTPFRGVTKELPRPAYAMPGPFPGRVIEVRHKR